MWCGVVWCCYLVSCVVLLCFRERRCKVLLVCFREKWCNAVRCTLVSVTLLLSEALRNHCHFTAVVHNYFIHQKMRM